MNSKRGFILIMIVVLIICWIVVIVTTPLDRLFITPGQEKAGTVLTKIYLAQVEYRQKFDTYSSSFYVDSNALYTCIIEAADSNSFICTATANLDDDSTLDTWQINQTGTLKHILDDAKE